MDSNKMHTTSRVARWSAVALCLAVAVLIRCADWPTRFERIDHDKPRVLDFVYRNQSDPALCEAAPGDTMLLYAYFSGAPIQSIEWSVSFNTVINEYFEDTAKDIQPLDFLPVPDTDSSFTAATRIVGIKFKIPDDIMYTSEAISEQLIAQSGMDKATLLGFLQLLFSSDPSDVAANPVFQQFMTGLTSASSDSFQLGINQVLQALTVPVRIFALINGVYKVQSDISIRYNRLLGPYSDALGLGEVYLNHNPLINFVGIYKVKNPQPLTLVPAQMTAADTTYCLMVKDSIDPALVGMNFLRLDTLQASVPILIDTGYSYYVAVDSGRYHGVDLRDVGVTFNGTLQPETYYTQWFYQHDEVEQAKVIANDLLIIPTTTDPVGPLLPPLDTTITRATLWVQIYDSFTGEIQRPLGSSLAEVNVRFRYTPGYVESVTKGSGLVRF